MTAHCIDSELAWCQDHGLKVSLLCPHEKIGAGDFGNNLYIAQSG